MNEANEAPIEALPDGDHTPSELPHTRSVYGLPLSPDSAESGSYVRRSSFVVPLDMPVAPIPAPLPRRYRP